MDDTDLDLFWHALNYRTAGTREADEMWQELQACVARLVAAEREACRADCISVNKDAREASMKRDVLSFHNESYVAGYQDAAIDCDEAIRARSNA